MKFPSIIEYLKRKRDDYNLSVGKKDPQWFFYDIYEEGYVPHGKDWLKRGITNFFLFLSSVSWTIAISILGIRTTTFEVIKNVSIALGFEQITWLSYGVIFGTAGSVIFCSIGNPYNSVHTRLITTLHYLLYYALFFIILNIIGYMMITLLLWT